MKSLWLAFLSLGVCMSTAAAEVVGTVVIDQKTYHVDVTPVGTAATIWLRVQPNMCSNGDILYMSLRADSGKVEDLQSKICRAKAAYDDGKAIVGCGAVVGTGICVAASVPSVGAAAVACTGVVAYTASKGAADCIDGISQKIAGALGRDKEWAEVGASASLASGQWLTAIDKAVDVACADIRNSTSQNGAN